jgi:hypothetical protein
MAGTPASDRAGLRIGKLSRAANVHIETIRYYERIGLLPAPARLPVIVVTVWTT